MEYGSLNEEDQHEKEAAIPEANLLDFSPQLTVPDSEIQEDSNLTKGEEVGLLDLDRGDTE